MSLRIALCAGEASGDQLGAGLIAELRARFPDAHFAGIGGDAMRAAGLDAWFDASELAVMGLAEVLAHLPRLLRLRKAFRQRVLAFRPDVYIGIDAPDFNLGVERWLKRRGVRCVHYVSPSVWAWRESRAAKIGASADRVLCLFPMEPPIYARHAVDAVFVGHPLADAIPLQPDRAAARAALGAPDAAPVLALLPGSRLGEIERMLPVFGEYDAPHGHGEVSFNNVRVPLSSFVAGPGRGFEIAQGRLGPGRIHHCMRCIGAAEKALELAVDRGMTRTAFGKPLLSLGGNRERIADARMAIDQARLLTVYAAAKMDKVGAKGAMQEISAIKVVAPNVLQQVVDMAIQIHGGHGLTHDFLLTGFFAQARALRLADGPDEVHKGVISKIEIAKRGFGGSSKGK